MVASLLTLDASLTARYTQDKDALSRYFVRLSAFYQAGDVRSEANRKQAQLCLCGEILHFPLSWWPIAHGIQSSY